MSDTLEETQPAHAPLGPSSAEGWTTCLDYVNANRGLPDFTSEPAAEGTAAHAISDLCLSLGLDADDFLGMPTEIAGFMFAWEDDDAMLLQRGIDELRQEIGDAEFYGERRVDISPWTLPGQFGTLDRAYIVYDAVSDEWWIVVIDLKWGRGIAVSPVENKQLMLYALGFWNDVARHVIPAGAKVRFRLGIDQPRHAGGGGQWVTTLEDLLAFGEWVRGRAALTDQPNAPRTASLKGCLWCRRRRAPGGCDTFDEYMIALLGLTWSDIDAWLALEPENMPLPRALTPERRSYLLLHKDSIKRWIDQLYDESMADAQAGLPTGEVKAVLGNKAADQWAEKGVKVVPIARSLLGERGFTSKLKTPKQMLEAANGNEAATEELRKHIVVGTKKPVLVPLADARAAITTGQSKLDEEAEAGD